MIPGEFVVAEGEIDAALTRDALQQAYGGRLAATQLEAFDG